MTSIHDCVSKEERKQRMSVLLINLLIWCVLVILIVATMGGILILVLVGKVIETLFAEYNVRRLQAYGCTVSDRQFPTVHRAVGATAAAGLMPPGDACAHSRYRTARPLHRPTPGAACWPALSSLNPSRESLPP